VTILLFDNEFNLVDATWDQITSTGAQTSATVKQPPHDLLSATYTVKQAGYAYVFVSNENPNFVDVYFDDVTASHTPSPIVSMDDYYPFGLTFNSYSRENSVAQNFKYNGVENEDELGLNINTTFFRMHDPALGRRWQIDPKNEDYLAWSVYHAMANNPVRVSDPLGDRWLRPEDQRQGEVLVEKIDSKIARLEAKNVKYEQKRAAAENNGNANKALKYSTKIANNAARVGEMRTSRIEIQGMATHDAMFTFEKVAGNVGSTRVDHRRGENNAIVPVIVIAHTGHDGNKIHEARHASDIAAHRVQTVHGRIVEANLEPAEVSGYRAEYAYSGSVTSSLAGSVNGINDINGRYVGGIMNDNGRPLYPTIHQNYQY
jgi:RHS repeat-associated protein